MPGPIPLKANTEIEEALRTIDEVIAVHLASLSALRFQRNNIVPISRLPPEILSRVFLFTQKTLHVQYDWDDSPFFDDSSEEANPFGNPSDWIAVTQVCSHWRNIALNTPDLWIEPPIDNVQWLEEMLTRSKDAGLVITADFNSKPSVAPGLELALKHGAARIKDLTIIDLDTDRWQNFHKWLPKCAPRLECLHLEGGIASDLDENDESIFGVIEIPDHAFRETDRLRRLELTSTFLDWKSDVHLFHRLTYLKLNDLIFGRPTAQQLVDVVLKGIPNLQFLYLQDCLPRREDLGSHIHLPACLQVLSLTGSYGEIEPFFRCVTFPSSAIVRIMCHGTESPCTYSAGAIIAGIAQSYAHADVLPFQTLILVPSSSRLEDVCIRFFTGQLADAEMLHHMNADAALEITFICEDNERTNVRYEDSVPSCMRDIFKDGASLLQAIVHVHFGKKIKGLNAQTIANTVGTLPLVDYVMASYEAARPFCEALQLKVDSPQHASRTDPTPLQMLSFSRLGAIYLREMAFEQHDGRRFQSSPNVPMKLFRDIITQRSQSDAVPDIFHLMIGYSRHLTNEDITFFKENIPDVDIFD
ncbi:hypothetical protein BDN70DRAFT_874912 [Pholiota conissans]|uniref:F-box domain-containing protein n=1 Tax=Pholiota conissans TaxID=109636 RepID=A0A9P6CW56_9AGAR|nr:hypothetical protein BDN70DRAFT_874912 [Pholiota conissans]